MELYPPPRNLAPARDIASGESRDGGVYAVAISETNTNYDGQDIIVDGAAVTIDGPLGFNSILL